MIKSLYIGVWNSSEGAGLVEVPLRAEYPDTTSQFPTKLGAAAKATPACKSTAPSMTLICFMTYPLPIDNSEIITHWEGSTAYLWMLSVLMFEFSGKALNEN